MPRTPTERVRRRGRKTRIDLQALFDRLPAGRVRQWLGFRRAVLTWTRSLGGRKPNRGNAVRLLIGGAATFAATERAIEAARHHIHVEMYMIADDEVGARMRTLLEDALERGVEVRLVYDAVGSIGLPDDYFDRLEGLGGQVVAYHRTSIWKRLSTWWRRNHRKLISVDGRVAIIGGVNWTSDFLCDPKDPQKGWYDVALEIRGPVTGEFELFFWRTWTHCGEHMPPRLDDYFPRLPEAGRSIVYPRSTDRVLRRNSVLSALLHRIARAEHSILMVQSYFIPNRPLAKALTAAARRGVRVAVVMPGRSDVLVAEAASRHGYAKMLHSGWELYEHPGRMLHAKVAVIDGEWSLVGSSNLNYRSFYLNLELSASVVGRRLGRLLDAEVERLIANGERITLRHVRERGVGERVLQWFCHLFRGFM